MSRFIIKEVSFFAKFFIAFAVITAVFMGMPIKEAIGTSSIGTIMIWAMCIMPK